MSAEGERIAAAEARLSWNDADIAELKRGIIMLEKSNMELNSAIAKIHANLLIIKWCAITGVTVFTGQSIGLLPALLRVLAP